MHLTDVDIHVLGEQVKAVHGDDVYIATLQRALAVATRNSVSGVEASHGPLTTDAVLHAIRTEFLKLLRPN